MQRMVSTGASSISRVVEINPNGLYCPAGDFYIDPVRPVRRAVISHGNGLHGHDYSERSQGWRGSSSYLCSEGTSRFLKLRLGSKFPVQGIPFGEVLDIGSARLSFHPSAHLLGAAQVRIEVDGEVWVACGDFKRAPDPTCETFEVLRCDALVLRPRFAYPIYRWPEPEQVASEILAWWEENRRQGRASVLFALPLGKTQRILAELARLDSPIPDSPVLLHELIPGLNDVYLKQGVRLLAIEGLSKGTTARPPSFYAGRLIIAPPLTLGPAWIRRCGESVRTALVSGQVQSREANGCDTGFALSDHADWPALIRTIEETQASRVLVIRGRSESLARFLRKFQIEVETLEG